MKLAARRVLMLLPLLLLSLFAACGGTSEPAPAAEAAVAPPPAPITDLSVAVDRTDLTLDYDTDTRLLYTVTTPADCLSVHIGQRTTSDLFYSDMIMNGPDSVLDARASDPDHYTVTVNEQSFDRASAQVTEENGGLVWALPVDFGQSGLYGAGVRAVLSDGTELTTVADAYIRYPEFDIFHDGMHAVWEAYILRNSTEPFWFLIDLEKSGLDYMHNDYGNWVYYSGLGDASSVFCLSLPEDEKRMMEAQTGVYPENPWDAWLTSNTPVYGETALVRPYENNLGIYVPALTGLGTGSMVLPPYGEMLLCVIEGEGSASEYIFDACRAAVCYRNGVAPDAAQFPGAAFLYERGAEILGRILTPGMNDYEKVKAIHDWMLADGQGHSQEGDFQKLTPEEQQRAVKSCYGFFMGYGGDCMGWSDTFCMLCNMAGVACANVSCASHKGGAIDSNDIDYDHRFNVAVLDGEAYYFDVYWDGAGTGYCEPPYAYFAMTGAEAAKSHTWLSYPAWGPPEATAVRYQTDPITGELAAS